MCRSGDRETFYGRSPTVAPVNGEGPIRGPNGCGKGRRLNLPRHPGNPGERVFDPLAERSPVW